MKVSRRQFLKIAGVAGGGAVCASAPGAAKASEPAPVSDDWYGCLIDLSHCVGCRKCEMACNVANDLGEPEKPFDDLSVFEKARRPTAGAYTVVNKYVVPDPKEPEAELPVYAKVQCMHCQDPACVSACLVGALTKDEKTGAVNYDGSRCMGCRYCMVACPFQIPAYEYHNPLTPLVRKCTYCYERIKEEGGVPACVGICPAEAIQFGKRSDLLRVAKERIFAPGGKNRPHGAYVEHVYGEKEVGGTGWMYLSTVPFESLGFLTLPEQAPPRLTETMQHGIFKYFVPPIALYSLLFLSMRRFKSSPQETHEQEEK